jgi:hypothetical protein
MAIPVPDEDLRATPEEREEAERLAIEKLSAKRDANKQHIPFGNIDIIHAKNDEIIRIVNEREARERDEA